MTTILWTMSAEIVALGLSAFFGLWWLSEMTNAMRVGDVPPTDDGERTDA